MPNVVVVGQGAAGLSAALMLAQEGVNVTSLSKVRPGNATCTIYAGGGFTLPIEGLPPEEHRQMTYDTGRRLNVPELLSVFSDEAPSIVPFLKEAGVPFRVVRGAIGLQRDPQFPLLGGKALTDGLQKACAARGVQFLHNLGAMRLIVGDRGVSGVECIDFSSGQAVTIDADAVVLATGGGGAIYERTDNPQRITGDGFRLALDAGCHLMDMEFVQFYPMGFDIPGGAHWFVDLGIIDHVRATGADGREFLKEMLAKEGIHSGREANLLARDKCSVAIALENEKGQCLLHTEDLPESLWREHFEAIVRMFPASKPPWSGPVPLSPIEHYFPGGVCIGTEGQTEVPGLFACGEVTGGVDGANRVGGNALTNCVLFGMRSARAAARHAKGDAVEPLRVDFSRPSPGIQSRLAEPPPHRSAEAWLEAWRSGGSVAPADLRKRLRRFSDRYLLPLRRGHLLEESKATIAELGLLLDKQSLKDSRDLLLATENIGLWYTAAAVSSAALLREESRGAHYRADFPLEDPSWERHIYLRL
jgi:succinate dehydrogenase/fumarate reductase flavoprotein subunit